ncbi:hypothetical protein IWQ62_005431 [Dispira parvispora]|uniref:DUF2415 domain-containing protein n=1 Tax=Dispira parvispora TaxID=1520584 RepID=A0A9W8AK12_9FUNG|nr:hypothetical protein IWQ62_005431 [Dispira parvispora]
MLTANHQDSVYYTHQNGIRRWSNLTRKSQIVVDFRNEGLHFTPSTLAYRDNLIFTGGFRGDYVLKNIGSGVVDYDILTTQPNGIITYAEISQSHSGTPLTMVSSNDAHVRLLDIPQRKCIATYQFPCSINCASVSPDGKALAVVGDSCETAIVDVLSGKLQALLFGHVDYSFSCAWSPDRKYLATGNQDRTTRVYDLRNHKRALHVLPSKMASVRSLRFSPDGHYLAMAESVDYVHLVDVRQDFGETQEINFFGDVAGVSFTPDSEGLYLGVQDAHHGSPLLHFRRTHHQRLNAVPHQASADQLLDQMFEYFTNPTMIPKYILSPIAEDQVNQLLLVPGVNTLASYDVCLDPSPLTEPIDKNGSTLTAPHALPQSLPPALAVKVGRPMTEGSTLEPCPHNHTLHCLVCSWTPSVLPHVLPRPTHTGLSLFSQETQDGGDTSLWQRVTNTIQNQARALGVALSDPLPHERLFEWRLPWEALSMNISAPLGDEEPRETDVTTHPEEPSSTHEGDLTNHPSPEEAHLNGSFSVSQSTTPAGLPSLPNLPNLPDLSTLYPSSESIYYGLSALFAFVNSGDYPESAPPSPTGPRENDFENLLEHFRMNSLPVLSLRNTALGSFLFDRLDQEQERRGGASSGDTRRLGPIRRHPSSQSTPTSSMTPLHPSDADIESESTMAHPHVEHPRGMSRRSPSDRSHSDATRPTTDNPRATASFPITSFLPSFRFIGQQASPDNPVMDSPTVDSQLVVQPTWPTQNTANTSLRSRSRPVDLSFL